MKNYVTIDGVGILTFHSLVLFGLVYYLCVEKLWVVIDVIGVNI